MTHHIISIEGNIGSGKSTLVKMLKTWFTTNQHNSKYSGKKIIFLQEPVNEWNTISDKEGKTMIELFYKNKEKYSFAFQMMAYISRLAKLKDTIRKNPDSIIICERSLYTDKNVFAKMLYDDGLIEEVEYKIYNKWFDTFIEDTKIDTIFYIQSNPDICYERIMKRCRKGEECIPLEYLEKCSKYHNNWLISKEETSNNCFILDGNQDKEENIESYSIWINFIYNNI